MVRVAPARYAGGDRTVASGSTLGRRMADIRARYDNAQTTDENRRNWWAADLLSAKSANSLTVRRTLRTRSRYETANNPHLFGVANGNADDFTGSGPTLQIYTADAAYNRAVEKAWNDWCAEVGFVEQLRICKLAKTVDGEGFLILKTVADMDHPVKLWPVDVEADQVTTPAPNNVGDLWVDGVDLHPVTGRATHYHVLRHHPGDFFFPDFNPLRADKVQARYVVHWFQKTRPGQVRGVPAFTASLDLFGELRSFRKAVLANAQLAASLTALLTTDAPANTDSSADQEGDDAGGGVVPFQKTPITRGMMTTLPAGFKMAGFDPKQPQTTYEMFQLVCLGEAIRPLRYPLNLALGTSAKWNFSSAKLDFIDYRNSLTTERDQCARTILEHVFRAWFEEAVLCGAIPVGTGLTVPLHEWHWPGFESIDPVADAQADAMRIAGGLQSWREYWARRGQDWRDVFKQLKAEADEIERLGLVLGDVVKRTVSETQTVDDEVPTNAA